jgi:putative methionine-R-sulfoxide reductase with GAF domain
MPPSSEIHPSLARERRQHPRCRVTSRNIVSVELGRARRGILVDVSSGGASVEPYATLAPGEVSRVQFEVPDGGAFEAEGIIKWTNASGRAGIKFLNVPSPAKQCLGAWLNGLSGNAWGLPTQALPQATAACLPPSFSPWLRARVSTDISPDGIENEIASLDLVSALRLVCDRARSVSHGGGAAIALSDGREVVCRARTGVAPDLGARFKPEAGLSGEALRSGTTVVCADTNNDSRVDRVACENLNIRSLLIAPIMAGSAAIGVIEVFSPEAQSFEQYEVGQVERLAELLAAMLESGADLRKRNLREV